MPMCSSTARRSCLTSSRAEELRSKLNRWLHEYHVLDEPAMLADIERALDDERSREHSILLADVESGELSVRDDEIGEALLAEVAAPHPKLDDLRESLRERATLVLPGSIEGGRAQSWLPRVTESFVLETRPVEHFNRQIEMFLASAREWLASAHRPACRWAPPADRQSRIRAAA